MEVSYHRYGLKLRDAAGPNARSARRVLEGLLVRVDGGYGCVHPWPELGDGPLEFHWQALRSGRATPLLERALHCAAVDAAARREGRSLFTGITVPRSHATVTRRADFAALRGQGFESVKLKGAKDWQDLLPRLEAAVAAGLRIRIDFNGVLAEQEFLAFARAAAPFRPWVDYVEDPVPYHAAVWKRLKEETGWPLALDRLSGKESGGFDVRILKPAAGRMDLQPVPAVITSSMDHPVGQAYAAWEAGQYAGTVAGAGLLTHHLFETDAFTERLTAAGPDWSSPGGGGLGFDDLLENLPWISLTGIPGLRGSGRVWQNPRDLLPDGGPQLMARQTGFATSGSTGQPSVVVHTAESLASSAEAVNAWLGVTAEEVWLRVLPEFHVGGYQIHTRAGLSGSRVVVDTGRWEPGRFVKICQEEQVTLTSLVPAQVVDLVKTGAPVPAALRMVIVGGGALTPGIRTAALERGWPLRLSYGSSEAASQVATSPPPGSRADREGESSGWLELLPHWEARVSPDPDNPPAGGGEGILELRGPALASGRLVREGGRWCWTPLADAEGWWRTADRVVLSGRRLRFAGRVDRTVKILGELVNLEGAEQRLEEAGLEPGRFAVVAVPELRRGMQLVVVWEETRGDGVGKADPGVSASGLAAACGKETVEAGPTPEQVLELYNRKAPPFAAISQLVRVERLPRSALGKIRYAAVRSLVDPGVQG